MIAIAAAEWIANAGSALGHTSGWRFVCRYCGRSCGHCQQPKAEATAKAGAK